VDTAAGAPSSPEPASAQSPASFADFGLPDRLVSVLHRRGMTAPFAIQAATLPDSLAGRDLLGRGRTGSGKTLAFGLPTLVRLAAGRPAAPTKPRGLVLVPTRELALQVRDALEPLGRALDVRIAAVVGGAPFVKQISQLRRGAELVVATPGRLADLIAQRACDLSEVEVTVLDEADQMCDMGFLPAVTELLDQVRPGGQRMLFSATLDGDVDSLVAKYLTDPVTHSTDPGTASVSTMDHHLVLVFPPDKQTVTAQIANRAGRTLLFVRTRSFADRLEEQLRSVGVAARALHGGKTQAVRTRTLAEFREGRVTALVATDVAARGIHVDDVSLVLHVDPAGDAKDYLHRAGRTARAGETGTVVTLVTPRQRKFAESIVKQAGVHARRLRLRRLDEAAQPIDPLLAEVTGAREPSGVPVREAPAQRRGRPRRDDRIPGQRGPRAAGSRYRADDRARAGDDRARGDRVREDRRHDVRRGDERAVDRGHRERRSGHDDRAAGRPDGFARHDGARGPAAGRDDRRGGGRFDRGGDGRDRSGDHGRPAHPARGERAPRWRSQHSN
ncbi:DEAD/DEAH box helicase, partial [Actinocatenispora thailandica]